MVPLLDVAERFNDLLDYEFRESFLGDSAALGAAVAASLSAAVADGVNQRLVDIERESKRIGSIAARRALERRRERRRCMV